MARFVVGMVKAQNNFVLAAERDIHSVDVKLAELADGGPTRCREECFGVKSWRSPLVEFARATHV